jgi:hypothetical protein
MSAWCGALCHGILLHRTIRTRPTAPPTYHGVRDYWNLLAPFYREHIFWHPRLGSLSPLTPPRTCNFMQVALRSGSGSDVLRIPHLLAFPASFRRSSTPPAITTSPSVHFHFSAAHDRSTGSCPHLVTRCFCQMPSPPHSRSRHCRHSAISLRNKRRVECLRLHRMQIFKEQAPCGSSPRFR